MKTARIHVILLTTVLLLAFILPAVLFTPVVHAPFPYRDYGPLMTAFMDLAEAHPQQVTYQAVGKSALGEDIVIFKIGNPEGGRVLFDGAMHGTEAVGSELLYSYAKWLLESNDTTAKNTLQTTYTLLIPVVNVDKENYARKNANGVDLNRNFATSWSSSGSTNSSSDQYRGPAALSEPESQTLVEVFKTLKPSFYVNLHMWAGPYYAGCRYANSTYYSILVSRIASLSRSRGITPFPYYGQFGGAGMAIGDAARAGIMSFLIELTPDVIPLSEVQTTLLSRFLPLASVLSQEAKPPMLHDYDVAVLGAVPSKTVVGEGSTLLIDVDVANLGRNPENLHLKVNSNNALLTEVVMNLSSGEIRSLMAKWNTSGTSHGDYVISAYAEPLPNETYLSNNNYTFSYSVHVGVLGDVSSAASGVYDGIVDVRDITYIILLFGANPSSLKWKPNADLNDDGIVNLRDIQRVVLHFNEHE